MASLFVHQVSPCVCMALADNTGHNMNANSLNFVHIVHHFNVCSMIHACRPECQTIKSRPSSQRASYDPWQFARVCVCVLCQLYFRLRRRLDATKARKLILIVQTNGLQTMCSRRETAVYACILGARTGCRTLCGWQRMRNQTCVTLLDVGPFANWFTIMNECFRLKCWRKAFDLIWKSHERRWQMANGQSESFISSGCPAPGALINC